MENFFIDDKFFRDLSELMDDRDIQEEELNELEDDWSENAEESSLEKIFEFDNDFIVKSILSNTDKWDYRFPSDDDRIDSDIKKAVLAGVNIDIINDNMPELYYPNGIKFKITKQDLIDYCA